MISLVPLTVVTMWYLYMIESDGSILWKAPIDDSSSGFTGSSAFDLNGDGENDVLIGATGNDVGGPNTGTIFVLYGPLSSGTDISTNDIDDYVTGQEDYAEISAAMDVADLDGDSWAELLIGDDAVLFFNLFKLILGAGHRE